jgi:predicted nucleic acid-binding protein
MHETTLPSRAKRGLAQQFGLMAYDAAYLDIAIELQVGLATLDQQLAAAAAHAGLSVVR